MYPSANLLMALVVILSLTLAMAVVFLGVLLTNARTLSHPWTKRLVEDLEQRHRDLEEVLSRFESSERAERPVAGVAPLPVPTLSRSPQPGRRPDRSEPGLGSGPTLIAVPSLAASASPTSEPASAEMYRRFGAIWRLADAGSTPEAIARSTGQPIGQVELILALRRQLAAAAPGGRPDA